MPNPQYIDWTDWEPAVQRNDNQRRFVFTGDPDRLDAIQSWAEERGFYHVMLTGCGFH